jgi:cytochrome c-type biogenesis protein CcmH
MEVHLAAQPNDVRGWEVIAPVYLGLGRAEDAARAFGTALRLGGDAVERLTGLGEALVASSGGMVSAPAADAFRRALALDAQSAKARFYLALAAEQDGDASGAKAAYETLLASAPEGAPWRPVVQTRLGRSRGPPGQRRDAPRLGGPDPANPGHGPGPGRPPQDEWRERERVGAPRAFLRGARPTGGRAGAARSGAKRAAGDPGARDRLDRLASDLGLRAGPAER